MLTIEASLVAMIRPLTILRMARDAPLLSAVAVSGDVEFNRAGLSVRGGGLRVMVDVFVFCVANFCQALTGAKSTSK